MSLIPSGELKVSRGGGYIPPPPTVSMSLIPSGELKEELPQLPAIRKVSINESNSLRGVERYKTPGPLTLPPCLVSMSLIPSGELKAM